MKYSITLIHDDGFDNAWKWISRWLVLLMLIQTALPVANSVTSFGRYNTSESKIETEADTFSSDVFTISDGCGIAVPVLLAVAAFYLLVKPKSTNATMVFDGERITYDGSPPFWWFNGNTIHYHKGRFYLFFMRNWMVGTTQYTNYYNPSYFTLVSSPTINGLKDSLDNNDTCIVSVHSNRYVYPGASPGLTMEISRRTDSVYFVLNSCPAYGAQDTAWF
ncbi:MAG: hypothetical protein JNL74_05930, partial [Fibrobacteres bacterium]|nr:hypothetical protein [Fibrobacterota bacterium]